MASRAAAGIRRTATFGLSLLLLSGTLPALEIEPSVSLSVIATDNVALESSELARNDVITYLSPAVRLRSDGPRYDFSTDYRMDVLYYARLDDSTQVYNDLNSRLGLRLIADNLRLDSRVAVSQVIVDPQGPLPRNNIAASGNRTDRKTYETSPSWQQMIYEHFFRTAYTIGRTDYSESALGDETYHFFDTVLVSPEVERGLSWTLSHNYRRYSYDDFLDYRSQQLELSAFWNIGNGWAPFVTLGLESDYRDRTGSSLEDTTWLAGIRRTTERSLFEVAGGERSFGTTFRGLAEYRYGAESGNIIRFRYTETPTNNEEDRRRRAEFALPEDELLLPDVEGPGTGRVYTRKRAELTIQRELNRQSFGLTTFVERNTDFLNVDGTESDRRNRRVGTTADWRYRLGERTNVNASVSRSERRFEESAGDSRRDKLWRYRLGADYELGQRTTLSGWVAREDRTGEAVTRTYRENQVGLTINRNFY